MAKTSLEKTSSQKKMQRSTLYDLYMKDNQSFEKFLKVEGYQRKTLREIRDYIEQEIPKKYSDFDVDFNRSKSIFRGLVKYRVQIKPKDYDEIISQSTFFFSPIQDDSVNSSLAYLSLLKKGYKDLSYKIIPSKTKGGNNQNDSQIGINFKNKRLF